MFYSILTLNVHTCDVFIYTFLRRQRLMCVDLEICTGKQKYRGRKYKKLIWALYFPFLALNSILNSIRPDNIDMTFACIGKNMSDLLGVFTLKKKDISCSRNPRKGRVKLTTAVLCLKWRGFGLEGPEPTPRAELGFLGEWLHRTSVNGRAICWSCSPNTQLYTSCMRITRRRLLWI